MNIGNENNKDMTVNNLICENCKHKLTDGNLLWCKAFEELPYEFPLNNNHDKILPDQKGKYIYEKNKQV